MIKKIIIALVIVVITNCSLLRCGYCGGDSLFPIPNIWLSHLSDGTAVVLEDVVAFSLLNYLKVGIILLGQLRFKSHLLFLNW
jgi:hypothetical protein